MIPTSARSAAAALLLLGVGACDLFSGPSDEGISDSELNVVRFSADAPALEPSVSFWAVRGQDREVTMRWSNGGKCLRLVVPAGSLARDPAGRPFAPGDSVLITVRASREGRYHFELEPSGLRFDPAVPARMEIRYRWADPDYNQDGVVDARDAQMLQKLGIWYRPTDGSRWTGVPATRLKEAPEVHASLTSFSQYALAVD